MTEWQPSADDSWYNATDVKNVTNLLNMKHVELLDKTEWLLSPKSSGDSIDDGADYIERWIRKQLRIWSGGDLSEFVVINPQLRTNRLRTDSYLQDIFRVVCRDPTIQNYLRQLAGFSPDEQVLRIAVLLDKHPEMKKSRFTRRGGTYAIATLIYRIGIDKMLICEGTL